MDEVEEIKKRIDVVELISGYIQLKKAGVNYKALCPFHNEDTPSFVVSPEKQIWHCFGCQKGGDIFTFIMEMEGLDFPDALKLLADRAGVTLKRRNFQADQKKVDLSDINEAAASFYHQVLLRSNVGKKAREYLKNRGLKDAAIKEFQIGYAPNQWEATFKALTQKKHFKPEQIEAAGLAIKSAKKISANPHYDRFRGRIMFPLRNIAGTVVGFSGRVLPANQAGTQSADIKEAKYVNTPETPIFHKSRALFGLDLARQEIRKSDQAILVEGQMDVVSAHQAGFKNVVATSGTALTPDHLELLKKYTENIAFAFDQDKAGTTAAKRAIETANAAGINAKLIVLPAGEDPDSLIKKDPAKFLAAIKNSQNAMEFYFSSTFAAQKTPLTIEAKRAITAELLPIIKNIADPVIRGNYVQKLAQKIGTGENYLLESLEKIKDHPARFQREEQTAPAKKAPEPLEERVLAELIVFPRVAGDFIKKLTQADFPSEELKTIYADFKKMYNKGSDIKISRIIPPALKKRFEIVFLKIETELSDLDKKELFQEIGLNVNRLRAARTAGVSQDFESKIREAESRGDRDKVKKLIQDFQAKIIQSGR